MNYSLFFRRRVLKALLSLPDAGLRFFCGGGVVHREGYTLAAALQFLWLSFLRDDDRARLTPGGRDVEICREEWRDIAALCHTGSERGVQVIPVSSLGGLLGGQASGLVPAEGLIFRPTQPDPAMPLLVFFHEGGGCYGGPELSRAFCVQFARLTGSVIYAPAYRLSPENRFPAALDDAHAAFDYALSHADVLGAGESGVSVGGAGLGGSLAARLSLDLKRAFKPGPVAQLLISPWLDFSDEHLLHSAFANLWPYTAQHIDSLFKAYAGAGFSMKDPRLSPGLDGVRVGQPKTLIACGALDLLAPQSEALAKALIEAHVPTTLRRYDGLSHGFSLFCDLVPQAGTAVHDMARLWRRMILNP